jgi:hypothetical protein
MPPSKHVTSKLWMMPTCFAPTLLPSRTNFFRLIICDWVTPDSKYYFLDLFPLPQCLAAERVDPIGWLQNAGPVHYSKII